MKKFHLFLKETNGASHIEEMNLRGSAMRKAKNLSKKNNSTITVSHEGEVIAKYINGVCYKI